MADGILLMCSAVHLGESGIVLEEISFNLSDLIGVQRSTENERIGRRFHATITHLLQNSK